MLRIFKKKKFLGCEMEELLPVVYDFLHFIDTVKLCRASRKVHSIISNLWKIENAFKTLVVHGLDSSDHALDIAMSDWILQADSGTLRDILATKCIESVVMFNFDEARDVFREKIYPVVHENVKSFELHNVTSLNDLGSVVGTVESLKLGLNLVVGETQLPPESLRIPGLKFLEIRGIEISRNFFRWLIQTLSSIESLTVLRLTATSFASDIDFDQLTEGWNGGSLMSIELMVSTETSLSDKERAMFFAFSNRLLDLSLENPFKSIQTLTMNCSPSASVWDRLSESTTLMHMVITHCSKSNLDLKKLAFLVKNNSSHLQIFVLKFAGGSSIHFDSILKILLTATPIPPLDRFELEVVMDDTSCVMESPLHSLKAATTLRCRYRDHMYFNRTKFGIAMASERAFCTDTDLDISDVCSPMELFREEMVRGMMDNALDSGALEAEMINQWNLTHQIARSIYVEIFDEFVDRYLNEDKCDVAATIANLRE